MVFSADGMTPGLCQLGIRAISPNTAVLIYTTWGCIQFKETAWKRQRTKQKHLARSCYSNKEQGNSSLKHHGKLLQRKWNLKDSEGGYLTLDKQDMKWRKREKKEKKHSKKYENKTTETKSLMGTKERNEADPHCKQQEGTRKTKTEGLWLSEMLITIGLVTEENIFTIKWDPSLTLCLSTYDRSGAALQPKVANCSQSPVSTAAPLLRR